MVAMVNCFPELWNGDVLSGVVAIMVNEVDIDKGRNMD